MLRNAFGLGRNRQGYPHPSISWMPRSAGSSRRHLGSETTASSAPAPPPSHLPPGYSAGETSPEAALPGAHVKAFARRLNIGFPKELRSLAVRDPERARHSLYASTSARHVVNPVHMRYLDRFGHAYCEATLRRYAAKARAEPLWWWPLPAPLDNVKSVVRSTSKFRLKAAFGAALRQAGYDRVGRRLPGTDAGGAGAAAGRPGRANGSASAQVAELYGTVRILARDPKEMLKLPFAELVQHVGKIVKRLEIELGRDRNGEPVAWPWTADGKEAGTRAGKASPKHRGQKASKGTQQRKVEAAS